MLSPRTYGLAAEEAASGGSGGSVSEVIKLSTTSLELRDLICIIHQQCMYAKWKYTVHLEMRY